MLHSLKVFYYYKLAAFKNIFGLLSEPNAFNSSVKTYFGHQTFRFPQKATKDVLISLKIYKSLFTGVFQKQNCIHSNSNSPIGIFDSDLNSVTLRTEYIKHLTGENVKLTIARSELRKSANLFSALFILLCCVISFPFILLSSVFSTNKLKAPLHILNTVEAVNLLALLNKYKIKQLHFFSIYENDANLLAYVIMKCGITVNKISSEVPLQFWNKIVVADTLSLCFRYQQDEYNLYKETMFVKQIQHWVPENSFVTGKQYRSKNNAIKKDTIGFYSSGMWLREKLGRIDLNDNAFQNEKNLFNFLVDFVSASPNYKLVVFLHPMEKKDMKDTMSYYKSLSDRIDIADIAVPNAEQFYNADVGVTLFSTLSYERLFWGFKTLIYPLGHDDFPIKNSNFNNVCAKSELELKIKLNAALENGKDDFFAANGLKGYRFFEYDAFKN